MSTAEAAAPAPSRDPAHLALLARGLYPYHDGVRARVGDQLEIQFRLAGACAGGDLAALDALLDAIAGPAPAPGEGEAEGDPVVASAPVDPAAPLRAAITLAPIVGAAFDLPPRDDAGSGLSCRERIDLLTDFLTATAGEDEDEDEDDADGANNDAAAGPVA